jgi:hypothetical protein
VENSTNSSDKQASQPTTDTMSLVRQLYQKREAKPMEAEPKEKGMSED